ncbi:MAG: hypothetical protein ACC661_08780, partial [Verrucomicrobiales bacterium]
ITSRQDGLFIVDARAPANPKLLVHYDTIEFATGIVLAGDVLFVACRNFGVEAIDVSDPANPSHLGIARTGEAQSVAYRDRLLYAGVWATSEIVVVDVTNPREMKILDRVELDGFGDGVTLAGDYLYAATGHHSRERPRNDPGDPGYGRGHGLEIFSLGDPTRPKLVGGVKFPPFYDRGRDLWSVSIAGDTAFVADTHNGVFAIDVRNPGKPTILARHQLPVPDGGEFHGYVGGLALAENIVYVAGGETGLHLLAAPGRARPEKLELGEPPLVAAKGATAKSDPRWRVYRPEAQVHAVDFLEDGRAVVACGQAGVHLLELWPEIRLLSVFETAGFATDVAVDGPHIYIAQGTGGLTVCRLAGEDSATLERIGGFALADRALRQVEIPLPGRFATATAGANSFLIIDIEDPANPEVLVNESHPGLLYGDQLMRGLVEDRYAAVFWHVSGLHWYDLLPEDGGIPRHSGDNHPERFGSVNGLLAYKERVLVPTRGKIFLIDRAERRPFAEMEIPYIENLREHLGVPNMAGNLLYIANRRSAVVTVIEYENPQQPRFVEQIETRGNPGRVGFFNEIPVIADGRGGLLVLDDRVTR